MWDRAIYRSEMIKGLQENQDILEEGKTRVFFFFIIKLYKGWMKSRKIGSEDGRQWNKQILFD